ncbi:acetyl/propionyl/methylcrotonyl-CoA carboxylase subunit alpha [Sphingomonas sp. G-3-2-10]|uniref:acetyl/propionyl/methylcrotonyl-CoA carboxylase subunit alpha n=1 Tax=Sphingomonas sp. G-3-2-10 TaxID=2728838 RepID=UPI00146BB6C5|nr:acetyl/propionyl/methylcrotonyl-CoA carboxylase subunit alpha [Sphingomonas sp. G-3-2-10]NML05704.1 acetyl/propionyl/methylcrotonyl-CoA carboxylase subunit alpha [Sphingomonas sp. G-3-2-10]
MIKSLLIANRGEIACRIIRTAREMGIRTVAVYSDADAKALHVREADEAIHIGPSPARESYLIGEKIIAAAKQSGAEAIHPGYGFLSENAGFAQAVKDAGLVWVGPNPDSITAMGLKDAAKERMIAAGVPVTPGYLGEDQSAERLQAEADAIGYPVLIKAVAGGGGKGMRRVDAAADFADALASCKREAASSFGDDRVLIEKYILSPRHIEVQVFGDSHGNVVHLFERDCSLQRRHQKVIEEAPAPGMDPETREAICAAAVRAAKAVDYVGAGTIEFIADASEGLRADRIWFMEMNTRLQVEHPVTEEITGQDLVEWQLRVASGEPLPLKQEALEINGWAVEARLYAEDPEKGFLPSTGKIELMTIGRFSRFETGDELRIDTGIEARDTVQPYYDPMIAKVIAWGEDRNAAIDELVDAMADTLVWPVKTNTPFVVAALDHEAFRAGDLSTGFIEQYADDLAIPDAPDPDLLRAAARKLRDEASLFSVHRNAGTVGAWTIPSGFRLNAPPSTVMALSAEGRRYEVSLPLLPDAAEPYIEMLHVDDAVYAVENGKTWKITTYRAAAGGHASAGDGALLAPMPGRVTSVDVAAGDTVTKGQRLLTLEAMKMEHGMSAPFDGVVAELNAEAGAQVTEGTVLVRVEAAE